ncbi:MAG: excinuclease ABC subunit UvrC [Proteobacteria bacterium]|nr:excinuclease ABC subunit UvrC [Pseudomonadota bacterium]
MDKGTKGAKGKRADRPGSEAGPVRAGAPDGAGISANDAEAPAGAEIIRRHVKTLPSAPGVYRMINRAGDVLYVGKAKNLKRRVASYTRPERLGARLRRVVSATVALEIVTTHTEAEALLLESNLIKKLKPRYNVLLRDDKSFPHIMITGDHPWPQITKHRGARTRKGEYFGPFASAGAVNRTLATLQRAFPLRSCADTIFASRTRPCLQYQIKRCTAPCVGRIGAEEYDALVGEARDFLSGRSQDIQRRLSRRMQEASDGQAYEKAAAYRDRIRALTQIQGRQDINVRGLGEADVVAAYEAGGQTCIQVFFFRAGQNFGNRAYFPAHAAHLEAWEVLEPFLGQFYGAHPPPPLILLSHKIPRQALIGEALTIRAGRKVRLSVPQRGAKRKLIAHALANAREALGRRLSENASQRRLLEGVAEAFALEQAPRRIEVYDNSHISGTNAVGAMIVAGPEGLMKNAYRRFTIRGTAKAGRGTAKADGAITPGDDYAMLREVLTRRFSRALKEDPERGGGQWPDLILIDGGKGHLSAALSVFADLGIDDIAVAAIAKGADRNAGKERFYLAGRQAFRLPPRDPVLYFLERLRDEAHRFAIGGHRAKRAKATGTSVLDEIRGIGAKRKRALLHHFGSARGVAEAGLADLEIVAGINKTVAKKIYDHFHSEA